MWGAAQGLEIQSARQYSYAIALLIGSVWLWWMRFSELSRLRAGDAPGAGPTAFWLGLTGR